MILSDFRQYWEIDFNQPNNHGRIYELLRTYYPTVASISPLADEMKSFESMYFSVKYPTLNVGYFTEKYILSKLFISSARGDILATDG